MGLSKKVALVTGGARRIGAAIVRLLHDSGFDIALHCKQSKVPAQQLADELNQERAESCRVFTCDLDITDDLSELIKTVVVWGSRLDVLVNNASVFYPTTQGACDSLSFDELFTVNVKACFMLSELAYPYLKKQGGCIVNITDIHGERPLKNHSVYSMTKAALGMQTKALAIEYAPSVRVNSVAPGAIAWPEAENQLTEERKAKIIAKTPLARHGDPSYIAQAVMHLVDNEFITGQNIAVDGGRNID